MRPPVKLPRRHGHPVIVTSGCAGVSEGVCHSCARRKPTEVARTHFSLFALRGRLVYFKRCCNICLARLLSGTERLYVILFLSCISRKTAPLLLLPPPRPPTRSVFRSSRVEDELLRDCFHTQMIGLNIFFFFFLFRPHPNIAPVSHRAQLSSSTCRQQTRGGALSEHRPGNGHTVGGPVAPRMSARFDSAAQVGEQIFSFFQSRHVAGAQRRGYASGRHAVFLCVCVCMTSHL